MNNNLVKEIEQIVTRRQQSGAHIPLPTYLYVAHYGRDIEDSMEEITALLQEKEFFVFKPGRMQKTESLLRSFVMEQEKHGELGKDFAGCVLIELPEETDSEELSDFLDYVSEQKQLKCLFTTKSNAEEMQELLEQHFFVRVVEGQKYECKEQLEILNQVFGEFQFIADIEALKIFESFLAKKEWQEEDMVQTRIENIAKNLVYEKLMQEEPAERCITVADAATTVKKLVKDAQRKNIIGFYA